MIELHGWLTISETCKDEDLLSQAEIEDINQKVNKIIANCDNDIELQYMNGIAFIRSDSQRIRHNEQETARNFVKVFRNKKEQASEFFFQICSQFS